MVSRPRVPVGKSGVTPCKHFLLDRLLGRVCGVLSTGRLPVRSARFYDLTAGDGVPRAPTEQMLFPAANAGAFNKHCSPGIYLRHCDWLRRNGSIPVQLVLVEKQRQTFEALRANVGDYLLQAGWNAAGAGCYEHSGSAIQLLHADAKEVEPPGASRDIATHIYNDPNHIEDWVLTGGFLQRCPAFTTSISTLGCNVNGLKRIDLEKREAWYERINNLTDSLVQQWHDACLFSVGGADQWAYLITAPEVWRDEITAYCIKAAARIEGRSAQPCLTWMKADPSGFRRLQDRLFLTRKEFEAVA